GCPRSSTKRWVRSSSLRTRGTSQSGSLRYSNATTWRSGAAGRASASSRTGVSGGWPSDTVRSIEPWWTRGRGERNEVPNSEKGVDTRAGGGARAGMGAASAVRARDAAALPRGDLHGRRYPRQRHNGAQLLRPRLLHGCGAERRVPALESADPRGAAVRRGDARRHLLPVLARALLSRPAAVLDREDGRARLPGGRVHVPLAAPRTGRAPRPRDVRRPGLHDGRRPGQPRVSGRRRQAVRVCAGAPRLPAGGALRALPSRCRFRVFRARHRTGNVYLPHAARLLHRVGRVAVHAVPYGAG